MVIFAIIAVAIIDPAIYRLIKPLVGRIRPCHEQALEWIRAVGGCGGRYSFPSSHAANLFGIAVVVGTFYRRTRYYLFPLAILVAIGRVYLGVHYPSDVVAGAVFGLAVGWGLVYGGRKLFPEKIGKILNRRGKNHEKED
jgi:undecaprenyl-diphosphatase